MTLTRDHSIPGPGHDASAPGIEAGGVDGARPAPTPGAHPAPTPGPAPVPEAVLGRNRSKAALGFPLVVLGLLVLGTVAFGLRTVVIIGGISLQALFCLYFVRHLTFAGMALRAARSDLEVPTIDTGYRPAVTVMVACHNEESVAGRLVEGLAALDYPAERLQILVVDDGSTDATPALLDEAAAEHPIVTIIHRPAGSGGGKSGALNTALARATGEIVIIFDADHRPHTDVVLQLVRHFADPQVSAVQGRCQIANVNDSPLATLVAVDYMAGYFVNEYGRQAVSKLPAYGGANCAVRASELRRLGGWNPTSVTEDTDLTMRMVLAGGRVRYDVNAVDDEEGVLTIDRYWKQRERWARGHQQCWRDYRRAVWTSNRLTFWEKVESTMFLFGFHLPVVSAFGLLFLVAWFGGYGPPADPIVLTVFSTFLFLGPLVELGAGLILADADRRMALSLVWFLPMFLISMGVCTWAWVQWAIGNSYSWVKTKRSADPFRINGELVRLEAAGGGGEQ